MNISPSRVILKALLDLPLSSRLMESPLSPSNTSTSPTMCPGELAPAST